MTLRLRQAPLRRALERLFRGSGVMFKVDPEVPDVRLNLTLAEQAAFEGLHRLVEAATMQVPELQLVRERGVYGLEMLRLGPPIPADGPPPPDPAARKALRTTKVTLTLSRVRFRDAVGQAFQNSGLQWAIHTNVPDVEVSLAVRDVSLEAALLSLVRTAALKARNLRLEQRGDVFFFVVRSPAAARRTGQPTF